MCATYLTSEINCGFMRTILTVPERIHFSLLMFFSVRLRPESSRCSSVVSNQSIHWRFFLPWICATKKRKKKKRFCCQFDTLNLHMNWNAIGQQDYAIKIGVHAISSWRIAFCHWPNTASKQMQLISYLCQLSISSPICEYLHKNHDY